MVQSLRNGPANSDWLLALISTLLTGFIMACGQRSVPTHSGQAIRESSTLSTDQSPWVEEVFTVVEVPPRFPTGNDQIGTYLRQHLRYPEAALKAKVAGKVMVSFMVTYEGRIQDVTVLKGYGYGINEEAIRLIQTMPSWIPGKQAGHPVNVKYNLFIPFELPSQK
ncbi:energy transducer TonB [Spirosoma koreense]